MILLFTLHLYVGVLPPFTDDALKFMLLPAQIVSPELVTVNVGVTAGVTVTLTVSELAKITFELLGSCSVHHTLSPLLRLDITNEDVSVPVMVPLTLHTYFF